MSEDIKQIFEFIAYLSQYSKEGIRFKFSNEIRYPTSSEEKGEMGLGEHSYRLLFESNLEIETEMIERFYKKHWEENKQEFYGREIAFIENQIDFLAKFDDQIKEEFGKKFNPLFNLYKDAKEKIEREQQQESGKKSISRQTINGTPAIPSAEVMRIREKLITMNFLSANGENSKAKPLIAALLPELAKKYKISQTAVLKEIAPAWKLSSEITRNFKLSKSKRKLKEYADMVTVILT